MSTIPRETTRRALLAVRPPPEALSMYPGTLRAAAGDSIRPFTIHVPQAALDERFASGSLPRAGPRTVADQSQGVQLATMQELARYWATDYDWRKCQARLNEVPQFITEIDGLDIHFIHVRSKHENALPLVVARMARLDHRAAEDHRSAYEPDSAWRERIGRVPRRRFRRCRATRFRASRPRPAGAPSGWPGPGQN